MKKKYPKSLKKYIRSEKTRINEELLSPEETKKRVDDLYKKVTKK